MSKLADAIAAAGSKGHGPRCSVTGLLEKLPKADRAELLAILADAATQTSAIHRGLTSLGHTIGLSALQRHRRGECGCAR